MQALVEAFPCLGEGSEQLLGGRDLLGKLGQAPQPIALPQGVAQVLGGLLGVPALDPADAEAAIQVDPGVTPIVAKADTGQHRRGGALVDAAGRDGLDDPQ